MLHILCARPSASAYQRPIGSRSRLLKDIAVKQRQQGSTTTATTMQSAHEAWKASILAAALHGCRERHTEFEALGKIFHQTRKAVLIMNCNGLDPLEPNCSFRKSIEAIADR